MAGIIISSSLRWTATGDVARINGGATIGNYGYEFTIPLKRRELSYPNSPEDHNLSIRSDLDRVKYVVSYLKIFESIQMIESDQIISQLNINLIQNHHFKSNLKKFHLNPLAKSTNYAEENKVALIQVSPIGITLPITVNPRDIPLDKFTDFPFPPLVLPTPLSEGVRLIATYWEGSNSTKTASQTVVVPRTQVKITAGGRIIGSVKLRVEWIWRIACQKRGPRVENLVVLLKLDGNSYEGWETPVTLQILLPNGDVYCKRTAEPTDIPLRAFKGFAIPTPPDTEIVLTVTAIQTGGQGTTLVVVDVRYE